MFAAVAVLWGLPYLFIRVVVAAEVDPVVVVWLRTGGATLVLLPLALLRGALRGLIRRWRAMLALAAVQITAPFLLITYSERRISSGLAGLLVAAEPLFVVLLLAVLNRVLRHQEPGERIDVRRILGLVVGLGGVLALFGVDVGGQSSVLGAALVLLAALLYAGGALLIRRVSSGTSPTGVITAILAVNSVVLTPVALPRLPDRLPSASVTTSLVALAVLCTAAAFVAYFGLIAEVGPARATVVFYVTPIVTVAAGALVLAEPVTAGTILGLLLIVAGSWLATRARDDRPGARLTAGSGVRDEG